MIGPTEISDTSPTNELHGLVAVVTGSSSGIGRSMALEFARAGANVLVHAGNNREGADATASEVQAIGCDATVLMADLREQSEQDRLVEQAWTWKDRVDIWVNNAGVDVLTGTNAALSFEQKLALLWQVDVAATMRLSRMIGERMKQLEVTEPVATILNIGWDQAEHGMAGDSGEMFGAIKGAVMAFSKSLAQSLAPHVRVNCIAPGWIKTSWGDDASDYWQRRARSESLVDRWGTPEDVARVARFLVSPAASFIAGQIIPMNGGFRRMIDGQD